MCVRERESVCARAKECVSVCVREREAVKTRLEHVVLQQLVQHVESATHKTVGARSSDSQRQIVRQSAPDYKTVSAR